MSDPTDSTPRSIALRGNRSLSAVSNSLISRGLQDSADLTAVPPSTPSVQTDDTMAKRKRGNFSRTPPTQSQLANKAKGTNLSGDPLTPEYIELLSATADMMVHGIRVKAWSFAEIVADLADTFGRENIPGMREYLERGWDAAVETEGVEPADYDRVFKEIEIPVVSNEEFVDGDWDKAHAGLASEAVQRSMAVGMEGVEGRVYGIREHSPGKWQMVSKPAAKPKAPSEETQNNAPAGFDPQVGTKVAQAAKLYIEAGALDFGAFIGDFVKDFGRPWVEDKARYLESAWRTANKLKWVNSPTGKVTDVLTEISPKKQAAQKPEAAAKIAQAGWPES